MKRLINSTTILSLALYVVPPFASAQEFPRVIIDGTEVICLPDRKTECPEGAFCVVAKNEKNCEAKAMEALAAAAGEAAALAESDAAAAAVDAEAATAASDDADAAAAAATEEEKAAADQAAADAAAAEQMAAETAAAEQAAAEAAAAEAAAAEAEAAKAAEAAAQQAAEDEAALAQAEADEAARKAEEQAEKDKAAADAAAADAAAADAAAADAAAAAAATAAADAAAGDAAAADAAAEAEATAAAKAAADAAAAAATAEATTEAEATTTEATEAETTNTASEYPTVTVNGQVFICLPDKNAVCPEGAQCVIAKTPKRCEVKAEAVLAAEAEGATTTPEETVVTEVPAEDAEAVAAAQAAAAAAAAAAMADPDVEVIEAPVATDEAIETLETALETPTDPEEVVEAPEVEATAVVVDGEAGTLPADLEPSQEATVTTEVVTEDDSRASTEEFNAAPVTVAPGKKTGLSDFEKVGLVALGALIVGAMINGNKQVVSNSGDRVVVRQPDGTYQVYKDDSALLREPGSTVRTETFADGSTRTIVQRTDGSQIVTIRDATGRVLQRVAYDRTGRGVVLIDDLQPEERVDVTTLPRVQPSDRQISMDDDTTDLRALLAAADATDPGRRFSLRQIRNIQEVRWLAPTIDVNNITFATGSSAIQSTEARKLSRLGSLMTEMIERNPGEVFLIEGHTDAVGSAASNLALSDRRAESLAKALTEYFDVPPENLVVQGYGEGELKVQTLTDERRNRRASVRIITGLLRQNAL